MQNVEAKLTREGWRGIVRRNGKTLRTDVCPSWGAALAAACEKAREGE